MKKTLLFAALAAFATGAMAQTWNFSDFTAQQFVETTEIDGFKIYATAEHPVTIDGNKKTVDGVVYTQRIKTGGQTQTDTLSLDPLQMTPRARAYEFAVDGPGTVEFVMTSSSSSGTGRYIKLVAGADTLYKEEAPAGTVAKYTYEYTGAAGTLQMWFTGGINLYMVSYTSNGSTPDVPDTPGTNDWFFNAANVTPALYSTDVVSGIYTFVCNGREWEVDANSARFSNDSTVVYTQRIKSKSSSSNSISIACPSEGTLTFGTRTGSNSAVNRTLVVTQGTTELYNQLVLEADTLEHGEGAPKAYLVHEVTVPAAGEVVVTMPTGALNYYFISFDDGTGVKHVLDLDKLFMSNNVIVANGAARIYVYDIVGKLVATSNAQELSLDKAARGIYIVKAVYADGKTQTLKVRR